MDGPKFGTTRTPINPGQNAPTHVLFESQLEKVLRMKQVTSNFHPTQIPRSPAAAERERSSYPKNTRLARRSSSSPIAYFNVDIQFPYVQKLLTSLSRSLNINQAVCYEKREYEYKFNIE
jgi:hypothetical protein